MPSTFTHSIFVLDVYDKFDEINRERLKNNIEELKLFAQGPDVFLFHDIAKLTRKKAVWILGKTVHRNNTKDFFINVVSYIKKNKLENNYSVIAFLYGFICHYVLDSTCHPFIIYKTGVYNKDNRESLKYIGMHDDMESAIDAYFIKNKLKIKARKYKPHNYISELKEFSPELNKIIDYTFKETFEWDNVSKIYFKSYKRMKKLYKLYRYDPFKIKRTLYSFIDKITPKKIRDLKWISYNYDYKRKLHYLNLEKQKWNHPLDKNETYNYSFIELYVIACSKAVNIINEVNKVLYKKGSIKDLDKVFTNVSYSHGKNCNTKEKMQYFEF
ncbi:MAG: zinc dependent phospholipase C family protein [Bacilli bacterium]